MAIVQLKLDDKDLDKVHIYSKFKNTGQWHLACLHIDELGELFEGLSEAYNEALYRRGEIWISYNPKIEGDL